MKKASAHRLYCAFLAWHPKTFRDEFGDELARVAAECAKEYGFFRLTLDCTCSIAMQWWRWIQNLPHRVTADTFSSPIWSFAMAAALSTVLFTSVGLLSKPIIALAAREQSAPLIERRVYPVCRGEFQRRSRIPPVHTFHSGHGRAK